MKRSETFSSLKTLYLLVQDKVKKLYNCPLKKLIRSTCRISLNLNVALRTIEKDRRFTCCHHNCRVKLVLILPLPNPSVGCVRRFTKEYLNNVCLCVSGCGDCHQTL